MTKTRFSLFAVPAILITLVMVCVAIEGALVLSDLGILQPRLRLLVYNNGGFWPGLLTDWRANFAAQPYAMFLTYGWLHSGPFHLIVNMATLVSLGQPVIKRVGSKRFLVVYVASILGGALGFGLLANTLRPMVGASGALFGLAGALVAWTYVDRTASGLNLWPVARICALLILLNVVLWWAMNGQLAWQTHLGGFLAGWAAAIMVDRLDTKPSI